MKPLLEIENLTITLPQNGEPKHVVEEVSLQLYDGEVLAIVGESGSGKSMTMKTLMNILPSNATVQADGVRFDGKELLELQPKERRQMLGNDLAMIFQDPMTALNPLKNIGDHLIESIRRHQKISKKEAFALASQMLTKVGIPSAKERMKQYPHEFSGGMRQRTLIAMALCSHPKLLIADEPTTALDVTIQAQILRLLKQLHEEEQMNIILITHDLGVVASIADRIAVMYNGHIVEVGTKDEILYHPKHAYTKALLQAIPKSAPHGNKKLSSVDELVEKGA